MDHGTGVVSVMTPHLSLFFCAFLKHVSDLTVCSYAA